jgi:hypothetical protein
MEQFPLLDIVIGLSLIYTFLSLLASELTELIITALHWGRKRLKPAMMILLGEPLELGNDPKTFKVTPTTAIKLPVFSSPVFMRLRASVVVSIGQLDVRR